MTGTTFGIVILAAGNSSRLGQPKQLLAFNGKSLIRHVAAEAVKAAGKQVMVVTGANRDLVADELHELPVQVIHNDLHICRAYHFAKNLSAAGCYPVFRMRPALPVSSPV
jgi:CTP:molybdopterin cytidylyltransferase MocA